MVNYNDPAVIEADFRVLEKFVFATQGVYIWEYFSTLWFEWSFITGEQPYRWSIWVYAGTRLITLLNVVSNLVGFSVTKQINCQLWVYAELITANTAFSFRSMLLILRIAAVWSRNRLIIGACICAYLTNVSFLIRSIVLVKGSWADQLGACVFDGGESRDNIMVTFFSEVFLLVVTTVGLVRERDHYLGRFLFNQCIICLVVAIFAEVPPFVILFINLNEPLNMMFQVSCLITMTICVTRMYRGLSTIRDRRHMPKSLNIPITMQGTGGVPFTPTTRHHSVQLRAVTIPSPSIYSPNVSDITEVESEVIKMSDFRGTGVV